MKIEIMRTIDGREIEVFVPETDEDHRWLRRNSTAAGGIGSQGDNDDPEESLEDDWVDDPEDDDFVLVGG